MATKTGIPRVGVETYGTNIKAPGINKHTTYTKGEVAEITDYDKVNRDIQKSIATMGEELGEFLGKERERKTLDPDVAAELGLDPESTYSRADFIANQMKDNPDMTRKEARQAWRRAKKGSEPADIDDTSIEEKKQIVNEVADEIGEKSDNAFTNAAEDILGGRNFNQLNRRQKILAKKQLGKLAQTKQSMATLMTEWAGADPNDISWKKYGAHPDVADFMQYIISGDGAKKDGLPYTFSSENGGTILYGDNKKLLMRDLEAGKHIYATADNKQLKKDVAETTKNNVAVLLKAEDKIIKALNDQSTTPEDPAYSYNREQNIRDMVRAEYNQGMYEDVWNAEMRNRFENGRYVNYNPEKHQQLVEDYLYEQYNEKMGEQSPLLVTDEENIQVNTRKVDPVTGGKVRVQSRSGGYKDVDAALYNRVKTKIMPVFAEMAKDPQGIVYTAGDEDNPMPEFDGTFDDIRKGTKPTSEALDQAMEQYVGQDYFRPRWAVNFKSSLNGVINKFNEGETLTENEEQVIKAYKAHIGAFDETMDLTSLFDKQTGVKDPVFNRVSKIVTLDIKQGKDEVEEKEYDLKIPAELEEFQSLIVERSGDDMTDATFIMDQLFGDFKYTEYKAPPPVFKKATTEEEEQETTE
tara:strand:- start:2319 stop:4229 length:1911 start_codon:yes stop_codon:yes gene_type:complete